MTYTIKEASDITGIPATTLRYYDKEGILPFLERKESGHRMFFRTGSFHASHYRMFKMHGYVH